MPILQDTPSAKVVGRLGLAKDDLVIACYRRSFDTIADAQSRGEAEGGSYWHKLSSTVATLLDVQFAERGPLLRTTALSGLPELTRESAVSDRPP